MYLCLVVVSCWYVFICVILCVLGFFFCFFFFKQKTAYEMRISDWSSACALPIFIALFGGKPIANEKLILNHCVRNRSEQAHVLLDCESIVTISFGGFDDLIS